MNGTGHRMWMKFGAVCLACIVMAYGLARVIEKF
jgi:hypothetical protein